MFIECAHDRYKIERVRQLVLLPDFVRVPLPCPDLPELVNNVVAAIAAHDSASAQDAVAVWEEERRVSKCVALPCLTDQLIAQQWCDGVNSVLPGTPWNCSRPPLPGWRCSTFEHIKSVNNLLNAAA